jgi:hypothetical protein
MPNITTFDPRASYIYLPVLVTTAQGVQAEFDAILDTGAPRTEFSDRALVYEGILETTDRVSIPHGLQTKKYSRVVLPSIRVCGHDIPGLEVFVSRFEESWNVDALIGLDFFRRFRTEIDYSGGRLVTEPLP